MALVRVSEPNRDQLLDSRTDDFIMVIAEQAFDVTVGQHDQPIVVTDEYPVRGEFHNRPCEPDPKRFWRRRRDDGSVCGGSLGGGHATLSGRPV